MFRKLLELLDVFNNVAQERNEAYLDNFGKGFKSWLDQDMDAFAEHIDSSLKSVTLTTKED